MINNNVLNGGFTPNFVNGIPGKSIKQNIAPTQNKNNNNFPDLPKGVHFMADHGGCGWWRMNMPELAYNYHRKATILSSYKIIPNLDFFRDMDFIKFQRQADPRMVEYFEFLINGRKKYNLKYKLIYEIDDLIFKDDIPDFNIAKKHYASKDVLEATIKMMKMCDMITTSTDYLRDYYKEKLDFDNIITIPNMSLKTWFDRYYSLQEIGKRFDKNKKRPRVLYSGSGNHFDIENKDTKDDFSHVIDDIIRTRKEFKWVFLGTVHPKLKRYVDAGEMEHHRWDHILNYPSTIWNLKVNAVIAPLYDCKFNKSKSDIKYLEACYLGIPGVYQDISTYDHAPIRFSDGKDMVNKLRKMFDSRQNYVKLSKQCRRYGESMWLDDNLNLHAPIIGK